jgi:hypothetical protein
MKVVLEKGCGLDSSDSGQGSVERSCEHCHERSGSV